MHKMKMDERERGGIMDGVGKKMEWRWRREEVDTRREAKVKFCFRREGKGRVA
jgi:hypothetical protein